MCADGSLLLLRREPNGRETCMMVFSPAKWICANDESSERRADAAQSARFIMALRLAQLGLEGAPLVGGVECRDSRR